MQMRCEICALISECQRHRIIPGLKYGGKYVPENIIMVCRPCHDRIHHILRNTRKEMKSEDFHSVIELVRILIEPEIEYPSIRIHKG